MNSNKSRACCDRFYRVFSRDVTAAMLVSLNKGTAAMLVSPTNPPGIEFYYHANVFFCFGEINKVTDHVSENRGFAPYGNLSIICHKMLSVVLFKSPVPFSRARYIFLGN